MGNNYAGALPRPEGTSLHAKERFFIEYVGIGAISRFVRLYDFFGCVYTKRGCLKSKF